MAAAPPSVPPPLSALRDGVIAIVALVTAPAGLLLLLVSRWQWTAILSFLSFWALTAGSRYEFVRTLLGIALVVYAVALIAAGPILMRVAGGLGLLLVLVAAIAPLAPLMQTGTVSSGSGCLRVDSMSAAPLAQMPLDGGGCLRGDAVVYSWEDCGGSAAFVIVTQHCGHRSRPDGSLEMSTQYSRQSLFIPWLRSTGERTFVIHPNGSVTGLS